MPNKSKSGNLPLIFGLILAAISLAIIILSGSPLEMIHKINGDKLIPPMWLWCLSEIILKFLAGYALGIICGLISTKRISGDKEIKAYQGSVFFIASLFFSISHYPVFFIAGKPFLGLLISLGAVICSAITLIVWSKISFSVAAILTMIFAWSVYVAFISGRVLISI